MTFDVDSVLKSAVLEMSQSSINVLIAYNEVSEGRRGMDLFCALRHDVPTKLDLRCDLWRFDLIGLPGVREAAVLAARHAQMIVVATNADVDVPAAVKDWLDQSFTGRAPGSAAMVALLHSRSAGGLALSPSRASLELMAYRRKFQFFVAAAREGKADTTLGVKRVRERAVRTSAVLEEILHRPPRPPRWGINE